MWPDFALPSALAEYEREAHDIAGAWLQSAFTQFGGKRLREVLDFSAERQDVAEGQAAFASGPWTDGHGDVRALWAAVQLAHAAAPTELLLERIFEACNTDRRERGVTADTPGDGEAFEDNPALAADRRNNRLAHLRAAAALL